MISIRQAHQRGHFDYGWLNTKHTFSFGDYVDPKHQNFRSLRVINEDRVAPGQGFPPHSHRDMEIITYLLEGALEHRDSLGTGSVIHADEIQKMSAGTGVTHSEYNPSQTETVHFLQIWILPDRTGLKPEYQQIKLSGQDKKGNLKLVASNQADSKGIHIYQDVKLYVSKLDKKENVSYPLSTNRFAWIQVARGAVHLNGHSLKQGDGAAVERERTIAVTGNEPSEILLFDLN